LYRSEIIAVLVWATPNRRGGELEFSPDVLWDVRRGRWLDPVPGELLAGAVMLVEFELIEQARRGDDAAYSEVVRAYRKRILGTIARLIGRPEDVEDVGQEVFFRLYNSLDQLRTPEVFEPWLYRLTVNAAYDYLRKQKRRKESRMSDMSEQAVLMADASAGSKAETEHRRRTRVREQVQSLLGQISEEDRILLTLKEVEGLTLKELEKVYGVNENALKVRLFRARQRVLKAHRAAEEATEKTAQPTVKETAEADEESIGEAAPAENADASQPIEKAGTGRTRQKGGP
jgi:RNA polymerase sigma-70 factor (ECF subfamily)